MMELRFWTFQEPIGRAADCDDIIGMVRETAKGSGARVADRVCDEILRRGLGRGDVCILLQRFGYREGGLPLWQHPDDAAGEYPAIWCDAGIALCGAWMDDFIAQYRARQRREPALPSPSRFHFDTEGPVSPGGRLGLAGYVAMQADERWSTAPVPGFGNATLAELHRRAGSPPIDAARRWGGRVNREWANWFGGVCLQSADAAMDFAAYRRIRAAWPNCLSSNYWTSAGFDGGGDPPRVRRWTMVDGIGHVTRPSGDLQAPVLYWPREQARLQGETLTDAKLRVAREKVDAVRWSWTGGGRPHANVTPWIELVGNVRSGGRLVTPVLFEEMIDLLVERGVREILVWSDPPRSATARRGWDQFADIAEAVARRLNP